jgi:putative hydrolase of the HAD superfamily
LGDRYLIWDFDGTLAYRRGTWSGCLRDAVLRAIPQHEVTADQLRPHLQTGFPWHTPHLVSAGVKTAEEWWDRLNPVFERAFVAVGIDIEQAQNLAREIRHIYSDPEKWQLYEDTHAALTSLSEQGWQHIVLSNHVPELGTIIRHLQLDSHFVAVISSAITGYEKPHPEAFRLALAATENAGAVWMIGDSMVADIAGAAAVGIPGVLVRKQHPDAQFSCSDLSGLASLLPLSA